MKILVEMVMSLVLFKMSRGAEKWEFKGEVKLKRERERDFFVHMDLWTVTTEMLVSMAGTYAREEAGQLGLGGI